MPATLERHESHWLIRWDGQIALASAVELKALLLEWLASGKDLQLDLERVDEIDITAMQLLWAAGGEAESRGVPASGRPSAEVAAALRDAGFVRMPGFPSSGATEEVGHSGVSHE